jgi:hypothetical protein
VHRLRGAHQRGQASSGLSEPGLHLVAERDGRAGQPAGGELDSDGLHADPLRFRAFQKQQPVAYLVVEVRVRSEARLHGVRPLLPDLPELPDVLLREVPQVLPVLHTFHGQEALDPPVAVDQVLVGHPAVESGIGDREHGVHEATPVSLPRPVAQVLPVREHHAASGAVPTGVAAVQVQRPRLHPRFRLVGFREPLHHVEQRRPDVEPAGDVVLLPPLVPVGVVGRGEPEPDLRDRAAPFRGPGEAEDDLTGCRLLELVTLRRVPLLLVLVVLLFLVLRAVVRSGTDSGTVTVVFEVDVVGASLPFTVAGRLAGVPVATFLVGGFLPAFLLLHDVGGDHRGRESTHQRLPSPLQRPGAVADRVTLVLVQPEPAVREFPPVEEQRHLLEREDLLRVQPTQRVRQRDRSDVVSVVLVRQRSPVG